MRASLFYRSAKKCIRRYSIGLGYLFCVAVPFTGNAQATPYDVHAAGEVYKVSYLAVPPVLSSIVSNPSGASFEWQSSSLPLSDFTTAAGATAYAASYVFTAPITNTTYFRRITTAGSSQFISNVIKMEVVSVNYENMNYIREHTVLVSGQSDWTAIDQLSIGDKLQTTTYLDNLGRPLQKVSKGTAIPLTGNTDGNWNDIVQFNAYDAFSRQAKGYLPYTTAVNPGKFKPDAIADQAQYYTTNYNEASPYSNSVYDNSPLNRISKINSPGTSWASSAGNIVDFDINTTADGVYIFKIGYAETDLPYTAGIYTAAQLIKTTGVDENGKAVIEFLNKQGRLILRKVQLDDSPGDNYAGWICTYNVYDDFGQLRFQIQPEAVKWLNNNGWSFSGTTGQQVADNLCFSYVYDAKGRNILKKNPGAKPLYMIYDNRDLLVFTQDGNQRLKEPGEWTGYFYDNLRRPVKVALYATSRTRAELTSIENSVSYEWGTTPVPEELFPADFYDDSKMVPQKYNYYDDYSFADVKPFDPDYDNGLAGSTGADPTEKTNRTLSMRTGSKVRVLGQAVFLNNTVYYDERGRIIQALEDNIKQQQDITTTQYDFCSRILNTAEKHSAAGTSYTAYSIVTRYAHDRLGRVTDIEKKFGTNEFKHISSYKFDDFSRLKAKRLDPDYTGTSHDEMEMQRYSYNIHGQLTGINKDYALKASGYNKWDNFFGLYLGYDNRDNIFSTAQLDGHITGALWSTQGDDAQRKYNYRYDNAGRLLKADFDEKQQPADSWSHTNMDFSVTNTSYDLNGNLLTMLQKGVIVGNATPVNLDDLQYQYQPLTNKLNYVTDNSNAGAANGKLGDFADAAASELAYDYEYDDNGNLTEDLNKNIASGPGQPGIVYNFLDKPELITIAGKGTVQIVYDADGNKLQRIFTPASLAAGPAAPPVTAVAFTISYINEFVYKDDELQFISFEEGRLRLIEPVNDDNHYDYLQIEGSIDMPAHKRGVFDFFVKDHQSNVRMVLTEETHIGSNVCTMETERAANEEPVFGKTDEAGSPASGNEVQARFAVSGIPGQAFGTGWNNPDINNYVSKLYTGASRPRSVGPNTLLKVMAGDKVSATTIYFYKNAVANSSTNTSVITSILSSLTSAISTSAAGGGVLHGAATDIGTNLNTNIPFNSVTSPDAGNPAGTNPKAYLTVLFFDERFNFVGEGSTTMRVQTAGDNAAPLVIDNVKAPKNGYAFIYISNESSEPVYFDNLRVVHERGRITEENHYYAYGLKIAGISSKKAGDAREGCLENKHLYQGDYSEYDDDIAWNDFPLRNYDPQIGRWLQQDPYQQFASPYVGMANDPVNTIDPSGGWAATGIFSGFTRIGVVATTTLAGALIGNAIYATGGGKDAKGLIVGAFAGFASNFIGGSGWSIGLDIGKSAVVGTAKIAANAAVAMPGVGAQRGGPNVNAKSPSVYDPPIKVSQIKKNFADMSIGKQITGYSFSLKVRQPVYNTRKKLNIYDSENQVGHTFVSLTIKFKNAPSYTQSFGFYPGDNGGDALNPVSDPPTFKDNQYHDYNESISKPITKSQFDNVLTVAQVAEGIAYDLNSWNCSTVAIEEAKAAGISVSGIGDIPLILDITSGIGVQTGANPADLGQDIIENKFESDTNYAKKMGKYQF